MKWLQWILDNVWAVVIVGGVLLQLLQALTRKKGGVEDPPADQQPKEYEFEDPDLAERTRKIREDIQRKIEQRKRGLVEPVAMEAEPVAPPPIIREVAVGRDLVHGTSRQEVQRQAEILEEQAALMQKLHDVEVMKRSVQKRIEFEASTADNSGAARSATRSTVLDDLRSPVALRRAFILREVLGPPVALR